jgi:hypothetical protein
MCKALQIRKKNLISFLSKVMEKKKKLSKVYHSCNRIAPRGSSAESTCYKGSPPGVLK